MPISCSIPTAGAESIDINSEPIKLRGTTPGNSL